MSRQVVQDEDLEHRHFFQGRYPIPGQLVLEEALDLSSRQMYYLQFSGNSFSTMALSTETLFKIRTQYPAGPGQRTLGTVTLLKAVTQYPGSSSRKRRLVLTTDQWNIFDAKASRLGRGPGTGTLFKIGTRYPGDLSRTKRLSKTACSLSGIIPKCSVKLSRTRSLGPGTLLKAGIQYTNSSSRKTRLALALTASQCYKIFNVQASRPG